MKQNIMIRFIVVTVNRTTIAGEFRTPVFVTDRYSEHTTFTVLI